MSDERIHRHEWENGRCKVCGLSKPGDETETPEPPMSKRELTERLDRIEKRIAGAEKFINLVLLILGIMVLIVLIRGR
ncbi:MAG: hypothetical protein EPO07_12415 [Verrucomicrobia bacterium]|nr:MAG: hypothetical protein EPO07_12415 [Verrucomicrobiota bacterium]